MMSPRRNNPGTHTIQSPTAEADDTLVGGGDDHLHGEPGSFCWLWVGSGGNWQSLLQKSSLKLPGDTAKLTLRPGTSALLIHSHRPIASGRGFRPNQPVNVAKITRSAVIRIDDLSAPYHNSTNHTNNVISDEATNESHGKISKYAVTYHSIARGTGILIVGVTPSPYSQSHMAPRCFHWAENSPVLHITSQFQNPIRFSPDRRPNRRPK